MLLGSSYFAPMDTQKSISILEIDLELFWINFFKVGFTLSRCVRCPERFFAWQDFLILTNVVHWPNPRKLVFYLKCGYVVGCAKRKRYFCKKFKSKIAEVFFKLYNKVHIFWEGHKLLSYVVSVKSKVKILVNFVTFWEYMNFI